MAPLSTGTSRQSRSTVSSLSRSEIGFSESVALLLDRMDVRRAETAEERENIYRLRYEAYLREGAISPSLTKTFSDPYDESENAYLFGLYLDGELVSSIRMHIGSREHPKFPSLEAFADVLQPEIDAGKVIIDSTRFVSDEATSRLHRGLPYVTIRLGWMAAIYFNAEHLLAAVRPEHQGFYRRTFHHRLICEPRPYPRLARPICLMTVHFAAVADHLYQRYPFFRSTLFERRMMFERSAAPKPAQSEDHLTPVVSEFPGLAG